MLCSLLLYALTQAAGVQVPLSPEDIQKAYDANEAALLERLTKRASLKPEEIKTTVEALGHIRSKKAVPLLLEMIEFSTVITGDPMQFLEGGSKLSSYEYRYPAYRALIEIGNQPLASVVKEIEAGKADSTRETLLASLGFWLHRDGFVQRARELAGIKGSPEQARWERIATFVAPKKP